MATYNQPKPNPNPPGRQVDTGYPQTEIGLKGFRVKGKFPEGTEQKTYIKARGSGAATRGDKFLKD